MVKSNARTGICAACKHDPECIYEASSRVAILECEQFEMGCLERSAGSSWPLYSSPEPGRRTSTNGPAGLCVNCEHLKTCVYPKPEGGVWRCEEYA